MQDSAASFHWACVTLYEVQLVVSILEDFWPFVA